MPHEFELFARPAPSKKRPQITIQRRGTLSINHAAFRALGSPRAVELLFDVTDRILGLRAVDAAGEHAYPLRAVGDTLTRYLISGAAFTKHYGIPTDISRRWDAELRGDLLCIDLTTAGTEVTSNRRGTGASG